jgi:glycosyltransferase involved in cell wall biosynthesis
MNPLVSIIIPVYNGTNYLREAIESAQAQTFSDYEILVIDDGSTDKTWEIIQSYGNKIRGFHKVNGGVASALNLGITEMRGKYFAWLSHDDLWLPEKLEKQVAFLGANPQFKACYTDYFEIDEVGTVLREVETPWYPRPQSIKALFGRMYIGGCTMMVERTCFDTVGYFNEQLRTTQDGEMWFRILSQYEIGHLREKLTKERVHLNQGSKTISSFEKEKYDTYLKLFEQIGLPALFFNDKRGSQPYKLARGYTWLGDTMAYHRRWFSFADEQYRKAVTIYPSFHNPARLKRIFNKGFHATYLIYKKLKPIIPFIFPSFHEKFPDKSGLTN